MTDPPSLTRGLARGLVARCPRCGSRGVFRRWVSMAADCPRCGLHFEQEQGYWLGAVMLNTGLTEGLFILVLIVGIVVTWPDVPWTALLIGGIVLTLTVPVVLHPITRTTWVALERHARRWSPTASRYPSPIQVRTRSTSSDDTEE